MSVIWAISAIAFLSASAFAPWLMDSASGPRWAVLSLCFLLAGLSDWKWTVVHRLGLLWLGLIALSAAWAISYQEVILDFWHWAILGAAFCLGSSLDAKAMRLPLMAWAVAVGLQGPLAAVQLALGKDALFIEGINPSGFFVNKNFLSEAGLIASVIALQCRTWWLLPFTLMALIVPSSKAAIAMAVVMGIPMLWPMLKHRILRGGLIVGALGVAGVVVYALTYKEWGLTSMADRLSFWANALAMFADNPWGVGAGNFWQNYPLYHDAILSTGADAYTIQQRPDHAHNEAINILAEMGIQGILVFGAMAAATVWRADRTWLPVLVAIAGIGMFSFPLSLPSTGFIAALVLGHLARNRLGSGRDVAGKRSVDGRC